MQKLVVLIIIFLASCTTPGPQTCQEADWYELGRQDGAKGLAMEENFHKRVKMCPKTSQQEILTLYINGRNAGLVEYCQPENGYELGKQGSPLKEVCPTDGTKNDFKEFYRKGERVRKLKEANQDLNRRISTLFEQVNRVAPPQREGLDKELLQLRRIRASNNREVSQIESSIE